MLLATLSLMTACASGPETSQTFCSAGRPIYLSKDDKLTKETARAIVGHNEVGKRLCQWKPPGK